MKNLIVIGAMALGLSFVSMGPSTDANAQPSAKKKSPAAKKTKAKKKAKPAGAKVAACKRGETRDRDGVCSRAVDFDKGDEIDGDTPQGYGDFLTGQRKLLFAGLIRLRTNFHAEILKSAADL